MANWLRITNTDTSTTHFLKIDSIDTIMIVEKTDYCNKEEFCGDCSHYTSEDTICPYTIYYHIYIYIENKHFNICKSRNKNKIDYIIEELTNALQTNTYDGFHVTEVIIEETDI